MWAQRLFLYKPTNIYRKQINYIKEEEEHIMQKFALEWHPLIESTPSHELSTKRKHDHFPLWQFYTHFNHLQIAQVMCLWTYFHVGLKFITILSEVNVGKKSSHWPKMGCLGFWRLTCGTVGWGAHHYHTLIHPLG